MKKRLWIRADGNGTIGMGHVMRCLTIADACREINMEICFLLADRNPIQVITERGYPSIVFHTDYHRMEDELPQLEKLAKKEKNLLLLDSYQVTSEYMNRIAEYFTTIYMDDLGERAWNAQMIVNYNLYAPELPYESWYRTRETRLLLGGLYAPIRPMFRETAIQYEIRLQVHNVLISTGGSDSLKLALLLVQELKLQSVTYHVICGPFSASFPELCILQQKWGEEKLCIHSNVRDMAALMAQCDVAVSAAGSTLYELCVMGVPTVSFTFADNQIPGAKEFERRKLIPYAGDFRLEKDGTISKCQELLQRYCTDGVCRRHASIWMRDKVDGQGAQRIAGEIDRLGDSNRNKTSSEY